MKKTLSLILAAVVVLSALVVLSSCGGSGTIVGEWTADFDLESLIGGADALGIDVSGKTIAVVLNLKADGKCTLAIDQDQYKSVMTDVYKSSLSYVAELYGMSVDDYLSVIGASSIDDAVDMMLAEEDEGLKNDEGTYTFENDVLTLNGTSFKVDFSGSKLVLKELISGEEESEIISSSVLPITFKRK